MTDRELSQKIEAEENIYYQFGKEDVLVMEKPLPYLCLYRYADKPNPQMVEIAHTQASYLIAKDSEQLKPLIASVSKSISGHFNTFMIVEIWPEQLGSHTFSIHCPEEKAPATIQSIKESIEEIARKNRKIGSKVLGGVGNPPGLSAIFELEEAIGLG